MNQDKKKVKPFSPPAPVKSEPQPVGKKAPQTPNDEERKPTIREEMDSIKQKRELMDKNKRKQMEKEKPSPPNVPKPGQKNPLTKKPFEEGEDFDMMAYMKKQRLAKEKEMLKKAKEDPNYKPLSPQSHLPAAVPDKDKKKLDEA